MIEKTTFFNITKNQFLLCFVVNYFKADAPFPFLLYFALNFLSFGNVLWNYLPIVASSKFVLGDNFNEVIDTDKLKF